MFEYYTKAQRNEIWDDYCHKKLLKFEWLTYHEWSQYDFTKIAPCPKCLKIMGRSQYIYTKQGKAKEAWKIWFLNEDNLVEEIENLIPVHIICPKKK